MLTTATEMKKTKQTFNDEFENYLKKQQLKTTFNGSELENFSWYKKVLGLFQVQFHDRMIKLLSFVVYSF